MKFLSSENAAGLLWLEEPDRDAVIVYIKDKSVIIPIPPFFYSRIIVSIFAKETPCIHRHYIAIKQKLVFFYFILKNKMSPPLLSKKMCACQYVMNK